MTTSHRISFTHLTAVFAILVCLLFCSRTAHAEADIPEEIKDNGIPILTLTIDPDDYERIVNSEDHSEKAGGTISIDVPDGYKGDYSDTELADIGPLKLDYVRGRGNATWTYPKKPFKLKLDKKADLLGMGTNKHWALLANSNDNTFMRNRLVSYMGRALGMEFVPKMLPVDFVVNGKYMGSYVLSEQIRIDPARVNIDELTPEAIDDTNVTGGYLLAMEPYPDVPEDNTYTTTRGVRFQSDNPVFASDDPEDELGAPEQKEYIFNYLQRVEDAIYGEGMKDSEGTPYSELLDLKSSADYWWIQEYTINSDAFITDSTRLYKKRSGKLYWGPLWDFDMSCFSGFPGEGFESSEMSWLDYMRAFDPEYQSVLREEWKKLSAITEDITKTNGIIDQYKEETRKSWEDDYKLWGEGDSESESDMEDNELELDINETETENPEDIQKIFNEKVEDLRGFYDRRTSWINKNYETSLFTDILSKVTFRADGEDIYTTYVKKAGYLSEDNFPAAPSKDGYIFLGWLDPDGNLVNVVNNTETDIILTASFVKEEEATKASDIFFYRDEEWVEINDEQFHPYYTLVPDNAQDKKITWEVSDPDLVSVDPDGTLHFSNEKTGDVTVKATISSGKSKSFILHLYNENETELNPVSSIIPEKDSITMKVGEYAQIPLTILPQPCLPSLSYNSTDEDIAEVDGCGVVRAISPGNCIIQISEDDTDVKAEYKVTVTGSDEDNPPASGDATNPSATKKLTNPLTVKAKKVVLLAKKLKKKVQTIRRKKALAVKKAEGKVTYELVSVKKAKYKKYFKVNKKKGNIRLNKKPGKGTYKLKIKVTAAGNDKYEEASRTVTVKIKIK